MAIWTSLGVLLTISFLPTESQPSYAAGISTEQDVQLNLKVQPGLDNDQLEIYQVELRKSSGESVRITEGLTGETVHFKHLNPDIYIVCLRDIQRRERCKSIDMYPPRESKTYIITTEMAVPLSTINGTDMHTVTTDQLQVPEKAKKELMHSLQAIYRGHSEDEIIHLQRAINIDPDYVEALNNLGIYYCLAGNKELSVNYLKKVTELDPDFQTGWSNLAGVLVSMNRWAEALKAALHGLALCPDSISGNSQTALCYFHLGNQTEAEKYFKKVFELDSASASFPMLYLARIALNGGRETDAENYIRIFLKVHPNFPDSPYYAGILKALELRNTNHVPVMVSQTMDTLKAIPVR